jgi:UDP-GlcNAc3NAcA epimerase
MKIVSIVGARPQFVKAAAVSAALRHSHEEILVHTGQHYDDNMSKVFFEDLSIPAPDVNLGIGSGTHGEQTGAMLSALEKVIMENKPDAVLVYGDTNSTLAASLAASKLLVPLAHVEAGLRCFDKAIPEEQNRICADHLSDMLFCPTQSAVDWLADEGLTTGVYNVGDVMYDVVLHYGALSEERYGNGGLRLLQKIYAEGPDPETANKWYLATIHRAENTRNADALAIILAAFEELPHVVVFPMHPRIRKIVDGLNGQYHYRNILFCEPVRYTLMSWLARRAEKILTDSGGLQKEAYMLGRPCVTLSDATSWVETLAGRWNMLTPVATTKGILHNVLDITPDPLLHSPTKYYGDGHAAEKIADLMSGITFVRDWRAKKR